MAELFFILKFFGYVLLVFAIGRVACHLLKLDKYIEDQQYNYEERISPKKNEINEIITNNEI
jgi:hypothetical protein